MSVPTTQRQLRTLVREDGKLELSLAEVPVPAPGEDEVLVRVDASPINPSDLGLLFGGADMRTAEASGPAEAPVITADVPPAMMRALKARVGQPLPAGNEGAGEVVAAGAGAAAQALVGRTVAILGGAMYGQYRAVAADQCLVLPEGVSARDGASCFVNPLTALGMVETMKREGHSALAHTAAASNLGQMLQKICLADGIDLVNVVRKPEQAALLREIGAQHVCNASEDDFMPQLIDAFEATGATLAFDAVGGGELASKLLTAMEQALLRKESGFAGYGSPVHKQVYIYGGLDRGATTLNRAYGMAWGVGGWLLPPFLARIGPEAAQKLRERVAAEITTTFASRYTAEVGLAEMLTLEAIGRYGRMATGEKYLVRPNA
jgi:NADPH:quinone reductase-like Zn-dependent oxidoreductase